MRLAQRPCLVNRDPQHSKWNLVRTPLPHRRVQPVFKPRLALLKMVKHPVFASLRRSVGQRVNLLHWMKPQQRPEPLAQAHLVKEFVAAWPAASDPADAVYAPAPGRSAASTRPATDSVPLPSAR